MFSMIKFNVAALDVTIAIEESLFGGTISPCSTPESFNYHNYVRRGIRNSDSSPVFLGDQKF